MAEICVFCKGPIDSQYPACLEDSKMLMLEILMEETTFDKELFFNSLMCEDCDKTIFDFFNFKSNFMETEDEFLNYANSENKVDLYEVLVTTRKLKRFANEQVLVKVCRICFKGTQGDDFKEIKSLKGSLAKVVTTCLPELNMNLTNHTYLCSECYSSLHQYFHFLLLCSEVTKSRKRAHSGEPDPPAGESDPLALDSDEPNDKRQKLEENVSLRVSRELGSSPSLLIPIIPQKRGRGRPRKEESTNPGLSAKYKKKQKVSPKNKKSKTETGPFRLPNNNFKNKELVTKSTKNSREKGTDLTYNNSTTSSKSTKSGPSKFESLKNSVKLTEQESTSSSKDSEVDAYECQICPGIFYTVHSLHEHMLFHGIQKKFVCWKCAYVCYSLIALRKHYSIHKMGLYKVVKASSMGDDDFHQLSKNTKNVENPTSPPVPVLSIPCPTCQHTFTGIDDYINYSCSVGSNKTHDFEKNINSAHEFGCGHCSAVFYSLDDLDEHNCTSLSMSCHSGQDQLDSRGKSDITKVNFAVGHTASFTADNRNLQPRTEAATKNNEAEYECSYCLLTFKTITGLDKHTCHGDSEHVPPPKDCNIPEVKKEHIFECSRCCALFESSLELIQHKCNSHIASAVSGISASIVDNDGVSRLIENDPDYDVFVSPESAIELGKGNSNERNNEKSSDDSQHEGFENKNGSKAADELKKSREKIQTEKKNLINKIANIFGVQIVEGGHGKKDEHASNKLSCIGCDFRGADEKDWMFHFNYCDKVLKCNYCSYGTNVTQKLEIHSWTVHNTIIYVCSYCRFVSPMEENYEAHVLTHKECLSGVTCSNKTVEALEGNGESDILNHRKHISDNNDESHVTLALDKNCFPDKFAAFSKNNAENGDATAQNRLFDFQKFCGKDAYVSRAALQELKCQNKESNELRATGSGQTEVSIEVTVNRQGTSNPEERREDENINPSFKGKDPGNTDPEGPADSNESLEDSAAFEIETPGEAGDSNTIETSTSSFTTEPVWLVESNFELAQPQLPGETTAQNELIIPDKIIADPLVATDVNFESSNIKLDTLDEQLKAPAERTETTVIINCDSDSDSEFVESNETRISNVAACAEEVCSVSASDASKLISQGVPVVTMQIESYSNVPEATASISDVLVLTKTELSTSHQSNLPTTQTNLCVDNQNESVNQTKEAYFTKPIHPDRECSKNCNEKECTLSSFNTKDYQAGLSKQSATENVDSFVISDEETEATAEDTGKYSSGETAVAQKESENKSKETSSEKHMLNVQKSTEKVNEEETGDSDGSSFFVTDNEESDRDDEQKPKTVTSNFSKSAQNSSIQPKNVLQKSKNGAKQNNDASRKAVERPFLPPRGAPESDDGVVISDEGDVGDNAIQKKNLKQSVLENNKNTCKGQHTRKSSTKAIFSGPKSNKNISEKEHASISNNLNISLGKSARKATEETGDSFVISDDDDGGNDIVKEKEPIVKSDGIVQANKTTLNRQFNTSNTKLFKHSCTKKNFFSTAKKTGEKPTDSVNQPGSVLLSSKTCNTNESETKDKISSLIEKLTKNSVRIIVKDPCVVIDDDDDIANDNKGETEKPNSPSSSAIIVETGRSQETAEASAKEDNQDSGDDCVFVSEDGGNRQSKNLGPPNTGSNNAVGKLAKPPGVVNKQLKTPPNALNLFISKVKNEIKEKNPHLKWGAQKNIILDAWRNMASVDKWPFKEEARLLRVLFKREHPEIELYKKRKKVQKPAPVQPHPIPICEDIEELLSD